MRKNKVCKIFSVVMILVSALVCPISSNAYSFLKTADGSADISGLKDSYIVFSLGTDLRRRHAGQSTMLQDSGTIEQVRRSCFILLHSITRAKNCLFRTAETL